MYVPVPIQEPEKEIPFSMPGRKRYQSRDVTTEVEIGKADSQSVLYQLYKPHLKDVITVKLAIGGSDNIDCSNSEYSVRVSFQYSMEGFDETSSKRPSKKSLHWNEDLTFHIDKFHLQDLDIECSKLVFKLIKHMRNTSTSECKTECYLRDILKNQKVIFKDNSKLSMVNITKVEFNHQPDVKVRNQHQLCEDEEIFLEKRKKFVNKELKKQNQGVSKVLEGLKSVPNIAVIGSGGGMRAVVGMCGAMKALKDLGILDIAKYTAGVSGSSWYLSALYANESKFDLQGLNTSIQKRLEGLETSTFLGLLFSCFKEFMDQEFDEEHDKSLTGIFGDKIGDILLGKTHKHKWSDLREMLQDAELPLPLLAAVHVRNSKSTVQEFHEWTECSPYEVFMPKYGTSIDMKHFGSDFDGGFLKKRKAEKSIRFLQGICGSAYAKLLDGHQKGDANDNVIVRNEKTFINSCINYFEKECLGKVPNWLHGIPKFKPCFSGEKTVSDSMKEIIDITKQDMTLADAGTAFNSPYPMVLHPARNIDVIISFDFSQNFNGTEDDLGELKKAQTWAESRGIAFPIVTGKGNNQLYENKMVRVFQYGNSPYIMHFMMNDDKFQQQGKQQTGLTEEECMNTADYTLSDFGTNKLQYSELEFKWLSKLMEFNVEDNEKCIQEYLQKATRRVKNVETE